jgi:threonyl-tRNA synthetase
MKYRIRNAQTRQVPYMLVVGEREQQDGAVAVRERRQGDMGAESLEAFIARLAEEVDSKALEPVGADDAS